jgi:hypothetical protein
MYGAALSGGIAGPGFFAVNANQSFDSQNLAQSRFSDITDGTSNTVMMSEVLRITDQVNWQGLPGDILASNLGASMFSTYTTPNTSAADRMYQCPTSDTGYKPLCQGGSADNAVYAAARSYHAGGVQVVLGDAAVRFVSDNIDARTWQQLGSRGGGETTGDF